jgi:hypothetical protein
MLLAAILNICSWFPAHSHTSPPNNRPQKPGYVRFIWNLRSTPSLSTFRTQSSQTTFTPSFSIATSASGNSERAASTRSVAGFLGKRSLNLKRMCSQGACLFCVYWNSYVVSCCIAVCFCRLARTMTHTPTLQIQGQQIFPRLASGSG